MIFLPMRGLWWWRVISYPPPKANSVSQYRRVIIVIISIIIITIIIFITLYWMQYDRYAIFTIYIQNATRYKQKAEIFFITRPPTS